MSANTRGQAVKATVEAIPEGLRPAVSRLINLLVKGNYQAVIAEHTKLLKVAEVAKKVCKNAYRDTLEYTVDIEPLDALMHALHEWQERVEGSAQDASRRE